MADAVDASDAEQALPRRTGLTVALVHGAAWTAGANIAASALNSVVGLALARLLTPADFGIQAALLTIATFFATILDTGLGSAVVQREELEQPELSSVFWAGLAGSAVLYLLVSAAAPLVARLFTAPALVVALPVAALNILAMGGAIVPTALMRRRLAFASLARAQGAASVAGASVAVAIAFSGGRYWALVGYSLTSAVVSTSLTCLWCGWRPSRVFDRAHLRSVRGYAGSMVSFRTVNYWSRNLDALLIGRVLGITSLGLYGLAQRLVGAPLQLLTSSIAPLLHPTFAAMGNDVPRQRGAYLDLVGVTARFTMPVAAMLWVLAEPIVEVVAGPSWSGAAPVVRALALLAAVQPVNMLSGPVFMARDAAHVMLRCATVGAIAVVIGMLIGVRDGVAGVAWGYSIAYLLVAAPVSTLTGVRLIGGRASDLARALAMPLLIGAGAMLLLVAIRSSPVQTIGAAPALLLQLAAIAIMLGLTNARTVKRLLDAARGRRLPA